MHFYPYSEDPVEIITVRLGAGNRTLYSQSFCIKGIKYNRSVLTLDFSTVPLKFPQEVCQLLYNYNWKQFFLLNKWSCSEEETLPEKIEQVLKPLQGTNSTLERYWRILQDFTLQEIFSFYVASQVEQRYHMIGEG